MKSNNAGLPLPEERPVIIFANGLLPPEKFVRKYLDNAGMIICADGGANRVIDFKINPDVIIGDLDSVTKETLHKLGDVTLVRRPEQESTDLQKALEYVASRAPSMQKVLVFGATGDRPDHFLGNISLLAKFNNRLSIEIIDERCTIRFIEKHTTISGTSGQIVSLWPLSGTASGITTTGLKYPLRNETLKQDTRGISNEFREDEATITVREGNLLVIIHHPEKRD